MPMIKSFSFHSKPTTLNHTKGTCVFGFYFFVAVVVVVIYYARAKSAFSAVPVLRVICFNVHKQIPSAVFSFVFFNIFCVVFVCVSLVLPFVFFFF